VYLSFSCRIRGVRENAVRDVFSVLGGEVSSGKSVDLKKCQGRH